MRSIELFAGAGGLAIGTALAGFRHEAVIELDEDSCSTIRENRRRGVMPVAGWPNVQPTDVRDFDCSGIKADLDLLSGGVPCQPWSQGGKHKGHADERNLFPELVRIAHELRPKAILVENVKGLQRSTFADYFAYIQHQIRYPEITKKRGEAWETHYERLDRHHASGSRSGLTYDLTADLLNSANFGVAQKRERAFIVAFRSDLHIDFFLPKATHSRDALLWDKWVTGDYWDRQEISTKTRPRPSSAVRKTLERLRRNDVAPELDPWCTVRDAIRDLPDPRKVIDRDAVANHHYHHGARSYKGHTGSQLDEPAKALKAGVHGVPGGENTLAEGPNKIRYFTIREAARLQTFPDEYTFHVSWSESMRQLGNAVPVRLAEIVAREIKRHLTSRH